MLLMVVIPANLVIGDISDTGIRIGNNASRATVRISLKMVVIMMTMVIVRCCIPMMNHTMLPSTLNWKYKTILMIMVMMMVVVMVVCVAMIS